MSLFWISEALGLGLMFVGAARMILTLVAARAQSGRPRLTLEDRGFGLVLAGWVVVVAVWAVVVIGIALEAAP